MDSTRECGSLGLSSGQRAAMLSDYCPLSVKSLLILMGVKTVQSTADESLSSSQTHTHIEKHFTAHSRTHLTPNFTTQINTPLTHKQTIKHLIKSMEIFIIHQ